MSDPSGDFPDITRLVYNNAQGRVVMTMRFGDADLAQNLSFYMRWRNGYYQVFYSESAGLKELRYKGDAVKCDDLSVTELPDEEAVRTVVPRGCLPQAPNRIRFQGIATTGLTNADETAVSERVARG